MKRFAVFLAVLLAAAAVTALDHVPAMRTVVPERPDPALPHYGVTWQASAPAAGIDGPAVIRPRMPETGVYRVQVGSFARTALAMGCFDRLRSAGFSPMFEPFAGMYRVVVSGIAAADMPEVAVRLGGAGFREVWIRRESD